ncbi:DNA-binding transcription factor [Lithospermum erythrorhizon]|uniref:DNA-binding transcription factor n=1 Tax=Lithospermum erythrorhizon TaxID=34254 RepID=A0AAV3RCA8_LITER
MSIATSSHHLQHRLKIAVQTVGWTYSLFWKMCPLQRVLVWNDGYYNGGIKTVKTVIPMEDTTEEVTLELQRSQRLKELYDMLSAGEGNNQPPEAAKRPAAGALSPEDLTETEWFYLMCISFSFPPGIGLPGKAFVKRQHEWLITANETNSSVFIRAVLAKTVVCIPILDDVVELGTTLKVEEDYSFIQTIKALFITNHHQELVMKLALSQNSTSNPTTTSASSSSSTTLNPTDKYQINEVEDEEENEGDEEEPVLILSGSGPETEADKNDLDEHRHDQEQRAMELTMQLDGDDMPEDIRIGSDDGSNTNVEYDNSDLNMFVGANINRNVIMPTSNFRLAFSLFHAFLFE